MTDNDMQPLPVGAARRRGRRVPPPEPQRLGLTLTDIAYGGQAIGHHEGRVVFVEGGIPGEEVWASVHSRGDYLVGAVDEVVVPSPHRVSPPCPYVGACGGCQWQHIAYPYQLELKQHILAEQLRRIGKFTDPPVPPTVPSEPWAYRNHARFSLDREGHLGFVGPGGRRPVAIDRCLIMDEAINRTLAVLQEHHEELARLPRVASKGARLHQVAVRYGVATGELLINPDLSKRGVPLASGQALYHESLRGHRFRVSAASFFQVNTPQAETLVRLVTERLALTGHETIVDAYAGVGTFAALLAGRAARVIAIEESAAANADAKVNLEGISNVELIAGKVERVLPQLEERVDAVILDPPRPGCHAAVLEAIIERAPRRVVYVSCDPATLARDLAVLRDGGYALREALPVDLFPQTYHIEAVATLDRP